MAVSNRCSAPKKSPAFSGAMWCPYRKPTQVGEEKILRRLRELWPRNSANYHRNFGRRASVACGLRPRHQLSVSRPQVALASRTTYCLEPPLPFGGQPSFLRPPGFDAMRWYRNINLLSIAYAFRPRLRSRLTPGGLTSPGKPWAYGERVSHPFYRYSYRHQLS